MAQRGRVLEVSRWHAICKGPKQQGGKLGGFTLIDTKPLEPSDWNPKRSSNESPPSGKTLWFNSIQVDECTSTLASASKS